MEVVRVMPESFGSLEGVSSRKREDSWEREEGGEDVRSRL